MTIAKSAMRVGIEMKSSMNLNPYKSEIWRKVMGTKATLLLVES
jgi:hypothetical protein